MRSGARCCEPSSAERRSARRRQPRNCSSLRVSKLCGSRSRAPRRPPGPPRAPLASASTRRHGPRGIAPDLVVKVGGAPAKCRAVVACRPWRWLERLPPARYDASMAPFAHGLPRGDVRRARQLEGSADVLVQGHEALPRGRGRRVRHQRHAARHPVLAERALGRAQGLRAEHALRGRHL